MRSGPSGSTPEGRGWEGESGWRSRNDRRGGCQVHVTRLPDKSVGRASRRTRSPLPRLRRADAAMQGVAISERGARHARRKARSQDEGGRRSRREDCRARKGEACRVGSFGHGGVNENSVNNLREGCKRERGSGVCRRSPAKANEGRQSVQIPDGRPSSSEACGSSQPGTIPHAVPAGDTAPGPG